MNLSRPLAVFAALNGAMAVIVGAFAAHGAGPEIKSLLTTGAHYQMVHALLALICAVWPSGGNLVRLGGWLAAIGGLVFCLALWMIARLSLPAMGMVAPIGGVLMILGWLIVAFSAFRTGRA